MKKLDVLNGKQLTKNKNRIGNITSNIFSWGELSRTLCTLTLDMDATKKNKIIHEEIANMFTRLKNCITPEKIAMSRQQFKQYQNNGHRCFQCGNVSYDVFTFADTVICNSCLNKHMAAIVSSIYSKNNH